METEHPQEELLKAEKAALRLIARAEQSSLGLTAKLESRGYDSAVAKTVVSGLLERNLLNDGRYAECWIRSRLGRAPSPQWLLASLGRKGIDRDSSEKALKRVLDPETEYALLLRYLEKICLPGSKRAILKHKGFSFEVLDRFFKN